MNLDWLARKHGTDKSSASHGYTEFYEQIFGPIRKRVHAILEVGIGSGGSLRMWKEWFPNATVYGVDQSEMGRLGDGIELIVSEQTDGKILREYFDHKYLQIAIDDCSHDQDKTISTLNILWPLIEADGWYVIEDMDASFPLKLQQWMSDRMTEYRSVQIFLDKGNASHIYFIHKK